MSYAYWINGHRPDSVQPEPIRKPVAPVEPELAAELPAADEAATDDPEGVPAAEPAEPRWGFAKQERRGER